MREGAYLWYYTFRSGFGHAPRPGRIADASARKASVNQMSIRRNGNSVTLPGFVDVHVHFREPGFSYKETLITGLTAAILGGIAFRGGSGNMLGVFMGIQILSTFNIGTVTVRFSGFLSTVLTGILLLIALLLDTLSKRARAKKVNMLSKSEREGET